MLAHSLPQCTGKSSLLSKKAVTNYAFKGNSRVAQATARPAPAASTRVPSPGVWPSSSVPRHGGGPGFKRTQLNASYTTSLLPGGQKQLRVALPAMILVVTSREVLHSPDALATLNDAASAGLSAVILADGGNGDGELFQAAVKLKEVLRERALVLAMDRTDITTGAGLDGVILTSSGVPVVVARRMLPASGGLVGCLVSSVEAAVTAAADGANLVLLEGEGGGVARVEVLSQAMSRQRSGNPIPVVPFASAGSSAAQLQELVDFQADGLVFPPSLLGGALASVVGEDAAAGGVAGVVAGFKGKLGAQQAAAPQQPQQLQQQQQRQGGTATSTIPRLHTEAFDTLVQAEKELLGSALAFLGEVCPSMGEVSLLQDALLSLDEPFLVVVVGEFNSGKSSVINALLGGRFLAEGVLPTTNEITVLRYGAPGDDAEARPDRSMSSDGFVERLLPAELLREVSVVDTPGTNVILERQQRLTEEYVPRADLVLFVMSMDRPFTESEVTFLEYIRRWKKKVVFVLNKADVLSTAEDLEAVTTFVKDNARRVLQLDDPVVLPVSARKALRAKMTLGSVQGALQGDKDWEASKFGNLEGFLVQFFTGASEGAAADGEGIRLKLQTPIYVAEALLNAASKVVNAEMEAARASLEGVRAVAGQMQRFQREMVRDGTVQRTMCLNIVQAAQSKMEDYVDRTLTLSNLPALLASSLEASSLTGQATVNALQREALGESLQQFRAAVAEHGNWLDTNISNQLTGYRNMVAGSNGTVPESPATLPVPSADKPSRGSVEAAEVFDLKAAAVLLEQEFKEAALGTAGAAAGAQGVGLVSASVMASTLEDLAALSLAGLASYLAVLNLPLRRAEIKGKLQRVATNFAKDVESMMEQELVQGVDACVAEVEAMMAPLEATYVAEVAALEEAERKSQELQDSLRGLLAKIASL